MRVEIVIKRISFDGVPVSSRAKLSAALENRLIELLQRGGIPESLEQPLRTRREHAPSITLTRGPNSDSNMGRALATRIYGVLVPNTATSTTPAELAPPISPPGAE